MPSISNQVTNEESLKSLLFQGLSLIGTIIEPRGNRYGTEQEADVRLNICFFMALITRYTDITELNTQILNELIDHIVVYEKVINPDGQKSQRVDIHYKFVGMVKVESLSFLVQSAPPEGISGGPIIADSDDFWYNLQRLKEL